MATDEQSIAVEVTKLRGELSTCMARIEGQLGMIAQSQSSIAEDVADLDIRTRALEERRWPYGSIAVLSGVVSVAVALVGMGIQK